MTITVPKKNVNIEGVGNVIEPDLTDIEFISWSKIYETDTTMTVEVVAP